MIEKMLFPLLLAATFPVFAIHTQITSLKDLSQELQSADEKTLIVFDVDEVLITTEDHFIHPYAGHIFLKLAGELIQKTEIEEEKIELIKTLSLSLSEPKRVIVEEMAPEFIRSLQQRGLKVIALTACPSGDYGLIPKVECWRVEHLRSLGIDFSSSFSTISPLSLSDIASQGRSPPVFEEGILFSGVLLSKGYTKGEVLAEFLKQANFHPEKVIFIDDSIHYLDSVQTAVQAAGIEFKGYQYLGAERFFKKTNEEVLRYQLDHLIHKKEWLSDEEIQRRLTSL